MSFLRYLNFYFRRFFLAIFPFYSSPMLPQDYTGVNLLGNGGDFFITETYLTIFGGNIFHLTNFWFDPAGPQAGHSVEFVYFPGSWQVSGLELASIWV